MNIKKTKKSIIQAGQVAVEELIKVAIFDAFEILKRIEEEENILEDKVPVDVDKDVSFGGFAEKRSK